MCDILQSRTGNGSKFEKAGCHSTVAAVCRARLGYLCKREGCGENKGIGGEDEKLVQTEETFACLMGEE